MAGLAAIAAAGVGARIPARSGTATVVGLTGGIGMGKSSAAAWFRRCGFLVHDADATVHSLYAAGGAAVEPVCTAFPSARGADGGIDRAALSAAVATAGREASLQRLEEIVHPLVTEERAGFVRRAGEEGEWLVVVDVPLLLETLHDEAALRATSEPLPRRFRDTSASCSSQAALRAEADDVALLLSPGGREQRLFTPLP